MAEKVQTLQEALDEIAAFPYAVPSMEQTKESD